MDLAAAPTPVPHEEAVAAELGAAVSDRYAEIDLVGSGAMGVVFRAVDRRLDRPVAIKVLSPVLRHDPAARARFVREAKAVASLAHPNVLQVYTVDELPGGLPYFTMQYVDGPGLDDLLAEEGALPVARAESFLRQIASALDAAHRAGIIHRDIKPQNILLTADRERVLLTDFGIAKGAEESGTDLTVAGALVGSPGYMSPEQAAGDPLDQRSDLYAMGVVAYEMLAGNPPFEAPSIQKMIVCHLLEPVPALDERRPDCPPTLVRAVHRCLEKEPGRRYASAGELLGDLDAARRASRVTGDSDESFLERLHPLRRAQIVLAAGAVAVPTVVVLDSLVFGGVTVSALVVAGAVLVGTESAGRTWLQGFELGELLRWRIAASEHPSRDRRGVGVAGPRADAVRSCRAERALLLRAFQTLARSEQAEFPRLRTVAEQLYRSVAKAARELDILDKRVADPSRPGPRGTEPLHRPHELAETRARLEADLEAATLALAGLRAAVVEFASLGGAVGLDAVRASLRDGLRCLDLPE